MMEPRDSSPEGSRELSAEQAWKPSRQDNRPASRSSVDRDPARPPVQELAQKQLQEIVTQLNEHLRDYEFPNHEVSLTLKGEDMNTIVVEVRNRGSDRVIMQFPPEYLLKFADEMRDMVGMVVDLRS